MRTRRRLGALSAALAGLAILVACAPAAPAPTTAPAPTAAPTVTAKPATASAAAPTTAPTAAPAATTAPTAAAKPTAAPAAGGSTQRLSLTVALPWQQTPVCCMTEEAAQKMGYYDKLGLDVTFVHVLGSATTMQTLVAGRADIASSYITAGLGAYAGGAQDIRFVGGTLNQNYERSTIGWLFAGKKDIAQPADLKGKTIGLQAGANPTDPGYVQINAVLASANLTPRDVNWVVLGDQAQRAQALVAGRVDFTTVPVDLVYMIQKDPSLAVIQMNPGGWRGWQGCSCYWTRTATTADPAKVEAIGRYFEGWIQMNRDLVHSRDTFVKAMGLFMTDMDQRSPDSLDFSWKWLREQYEVNGGMNLQDMQAWLDKVYFASVAPDNKGKVDLKSVVDTQFVKRVVDKLGPNDEVHQDPPQLTLGA